ncbi:uncharacterized protein isoform X2 [Castor canadensis]|uniref:Uncharacterized protein isoform X2 n=1 Tax=Castor canadensis TaxID=51338 RepID=A0AC58LZL0_CASCN
MMLRKKKNPYTILNRKSFLELKMPFKKQQRKTAGAHSREFIYGLENFVYKDIKPGFLDCSLDCTFVKRTGSIHSLKSSSGVRLVECSNRAQFLLLVAVEAGRPLVIQSGPKN